jgi:hypothetical protein
MYVEDFQDDEGDIVGDLDICGRDSPNGRTSHMTMSDRVQQLLSSSQHKQVIT